MIALQIKLYTLDQENPKRMDKTISEHLVSAENV